MRLPTEEQAVGWAKAEALRLPDQPTQVRKYLLMLLHIIKRLEARIRELEQLQRPGDRAG